MVSQYSIDRMYVTITWKAEQTNLSVRILGPFYYVANQGNSFATSPVTRVVTKKMVSALNIKKFLP